jgi:hypothetical protein
MLPEEKTGVVILSNLDGNDLTYALMYRVFDAYLKQPRHTPRRRGRPPCDYLVYSCDDPR